MLIERKAKRHSSLKSLQHADDDFIVDEVRSNDCFHGSLRPGRGRGKSPA